MEIYRAIALVGGLVGIVLVILGLFLGLIAIFGPKGKTWPN